MTSTGRWTPDPGEGTSPTRTLTVSASARALTDPAAARHLAELFEDADSWLIERCPHHGAEVAFLADLVLALESYARELEHAHDEVIRDVAHRWPVELPGDDSGGEGP